MPNNRYSKGNTEPTGIQHSIGFKWSIYPSVNSVYQMISEQPLSTRYLFYASEKKNSIREWINHTPMIVTESLQLHVQSSHHHKPKEARPYIYGLLKSLLKQSLKLHVLQAK